MRDTTEAMQIFDSLPPELQDKALTLMRLVLADDTEKIRLFYEQEGLAPHRDHENPA